VIFPSAAGTLRDPNNFGKQCRTVRDELGVTEVSTHSFRKTVATLIDDEGLSAIGADQLGHSRVSMTQDRCMSRGWGAYRGCRPLGPHHKRRINVDSAPVILKNSLQREAGGARTRDQRIMRASDLGLC